MSGPLLVFLFSASQAIRDVFFPYLFEGHGFFDVVLIVFLSATVSGWVVVFIFESDQVSRLCRYWKPLALISLATAVAWTCYFFALTHIEPAIANTLFSGAGPFVIIMASFFSRSEKQIYKQGRLEQFCYAGLFVTLLAIILVAVSGKSGLGMITPRGALLGALSAIASGSLMSLSLLISRRLNDAGVTANAVMAVRFSLGVLMAAAMITIQQQPSGINLDSATVIVTIAAICLIVLPGYALQSGVSKTAPLTVQVIVSLSPIMVFAAQLLDGRVHYASATLICLIFYAIFILSLNVLRGWASESVKQA